MKFVSRKDMAFIAILLVVVVVFTVFTAGGATAVTFGDEVVSITASDFEFNIAYADVEEITLTVLPDLGEVDDGTNIASLKCGSWVNDTWGEYTLCIYPQVESGIVVSLTDGRTVVFNCEDEDSTESAFSEFQEKLGE